METTEIQHVMTWVPNVCFVAFEFVPSSCVLWGRRCLTIVLGTNLSYWTYLLATTLKATVYYSIINVETFNFSRQLILNLIVNILFLLSNLRESKRIDE